MLTIAVTGRFASGKSTVARMLATKGGVLIDADETARKALDDSSPVSEQIEKIFGPAILDENNRIDRKKLARVVFSDRKKLRRLENVIHPFVREHIKRTLARLKEQKKDFAIIDVPLLEKSGLVDVIDVSISVNSTDENIYKRAKSGGFEEQDISNRLNMQPSVERLTKIADYVIENNGSLGDLKKQVDELYKAKLEKKLKCREN